MNILFVTHPYPKYVPDLLLHGLRKLLGPKAVEYPRKGCLYEGELGLGISSEGAGGWGRLSVENTTRSLCYMPS
jgi:hypothetical protein